MYSKSDNIEIMINDKANEVVEELCESLLSGLQTRLGTSMRSSDFIFDCVHLIYFECYKINFKLGKSYKVSPGLKKNKKSNNKSYQ